jgi:5-methylcytosine-specific restriction enzyme subunit McrC
VTAREIGLTELGVPVSVELSADAGRLLAASGVVTAVPSAYQPGWWMVGPFRKVGVARVGDVVVRVTPKVPIARLLFLLGYSVHGPAWQASTVDLGDAPDLVAAVAQALWRQVSHAIGQGLLPGYVTVEESSPVLRGRLLESAQLARHHGVPLPLEIRHDEFTVDIPENQILRTACERMLLVPRVSAETQVRLRRLLREFGSLVGSLDRGDMIPGWQPTRLNTRYHAALRLAELVLRATLVEHSAGNVAVNGFLLDMPRLFEDFVTVALREALEGSFGGRVVAQARGHLDLAGRVVLKPDITWQVGGTVMAVADAKYKAEKPAGYPNADLYQLLAYCTVLGLRVGHLVYAAGNEEPVRHIVRGAGVEIICHALDLSQPPEELLAEVRDLATYLSWASLARTGEQGYGSRHWGDGRGTSQGKRSGIK